MTIYEYYHMIATLETLAVPVWFLISIIFFILGLKSKIRHPVVIKWLGIIMFAGMFIYLFLTGPGPGLDRPEEAIAKKSTYYIDNAIKAYAFDHGGVLPEDISVICPKYLYTLPENVYTGQPMRDIAFGEEPYAGEFSYEPVYTDSEITGYLLLLYGSKKTDGMDIDLDSNRDHVILAITSDEGNEVYLKWLESRGISQEEYKDWLER